MGEGGQLLVLDVGNTNTVLGLYEGETLVEHWRVATNPRSTTDELGLLFVNLFAAQGRDHRLVTRAVCASVVPPVVHSISRAGTRYFGVDVDFVGPDLDCGVPFRDVNPAEVGADRIVNAAAAYHRYKGACLIVDFGTATTFDVVDSDGAYCGGAIAPGIGISLDALTSRASKLPRVEISKPERVIGHTTVASMQSGIVYGYVGLVDGIVARLLVEMRNDLGASDVKVIATGGLASLISGESQYLDAVDAFLTLTGLKLIAARNPK